MAEQNAFLNIGGGAIPGNATVPDYKDQTVVQSLSYDISQGGEWEESEQLTARVTTFGDLVIGKDMDNGSPGLALACAMKTQYDDAELNLVAGGSVYLNVKLEKVIVRSVSVGYSSGDPKPGETVTLGYRKATWRWGTATTSYDLAQNQE